MKKKDLKRERNPIKPSVICCVWVNHFRDRDSHSELSRTSILSKVGYTYNDLAIIKVWVRFA